jgi:cytochrome c oxidase subunit II
VRRRSLVRTLAIGAALAACSACAPSGAPSVLDPKGLGARRIEGLWWLMFWISVAVFAVVVAFLAVAFLRGHSKQPRLSEARWGGPFVVVSGIVAPSLILAGVFVVSLNDMMELSTPPQEPGLTIDVIGHDWWWEARYEDGGAGTANEIHIPTGESVQLRTSSTASGCLNFRPKRTLSRAKLTTCGSRQMSRAATVASAQSFAACNMPT